MTSAKKAKEIYNKFFSVLMYNLPPGQRAYAKTIHGIDPLAKFIADCSLHVHEQAKKCAIICIDKLIDNSTNGCNECGGSGVYEKDFLLEVKQVLEKL